MFILLDIDGVLETTPTWRKPEIAEDGFYRLNPTAVNNLIKILSITNAGIILTTTHRFNYTIAEWTKMLNARSIIPSSVAIINNKTSLAEMGSRADEIKQWVKEQSPKTRFVIIDDDFSLHDLPESIKKNWVQTKQITGLDESSTEKVLKVWANHYRKP